MIRDDSKKNKLLEQLLNDYLAADISDAEKEMLKYAEKLTKNPSSLVKKDVDNLKKFNFIDRDLLDINQVAAYFNYVNRTADGLGVELEEDYKK